MDIVVFRKSNPNILWERFGSIEKASAFVDQMLNKEAPDFAAFDTRRWQIVHPVDEDCAFEIVTAGNGHTESQPARIEIQPTEQHATFHSAINGQCGCGRDTDAVGQLHAAE